MPRYVDRVGGQLPANLQSVLSTRSNSRLARGIIARHGRLSVIKVDLCIRYYYSTTQNRNTGNLHRPPGGLKTLLEYRYVIPPLFVHTTIATLRAQHSSARCTLAAVVWAEYYQRRA